MGFALFATGQHALAAKDALQVISMPFSNFTTYDYYVIINFFCGVMIEFIWH